MAERKEEGMAPSSPIHCVQLYNVFRPLRRDVLFRFLSELPVDRLGRKIAAVSAQRLLDHAKNNLQNIMRDEKHGVSVARFKFIGDVVELAKSEHDTLGEKTLQMCQKVKG